MTFQQMELAYAISFSQAVMIPGSVKAKASNKYLVSVSCAMGTDSSLRIMILAEFRPIHTWCWYNQSLPDMILYSFKFMTSNYCISFILWYSRCALMTKLIFNLEPCMANYRPTTLSSNVHFSFNWFTSVNNMKSSRDPESNNTLAGWSLMLIFITTSLDSNHLFVLAQAVFVVCYDLIPPWTVPEFCFSATRTQNKHGTQKKIQPDVFCLIQHRYR